MGPVLDYSHSLWTMTLELSPWLLLGLLLAGVIKAVAPMAWIARRLGGRGLGSVVWAGLLGAPLPLCSCSVLPVAVGLRRQGASRGATASFLVSTPETGVDSVAVTYAILGPFMAVARPIAAVVSAVAVGLAVGMTPARRTPAANGGDARGAGDAGCCQTGAGGCGDDEACRGNNAGAKSADCCASESDDCCETEPASASACAANDAACGCNAANDGDTPQTLPRRLAAGVGYAMTTLLDDLLLWLVLGLLAAAAVDAFVPAAWLTAWGRGLPAMLIVLLISVPMYVCATASTPLAGALLLGGASPGVVLVLLLAGPATNVATFGVLRREIGYAATAVFLVTLAGVSVMLGITLDVAVAAWGVDIVASVGEPREGAGVGLAIAAFAALVLATVWIKMPARWRDAIRLRFAFSRNGSSGMAAGRDSATETETRPEF